MLFTSANKETLEDRDSLNRVSDEEVSSEFTYESDEVIAKEGEMLFY